MIETLPWIEKNPAITRISGTFRETVNQSSAHFYLHCVEESEVHDMPNGLVPSAFPDHLQILSQFDPAAVRQEAAEIYAWINHAIAADNRAGINHRVAADLCSVADDCTEFS